MLIRVAVVILIALNASALHAATTEQVEKSLDKAKAWLYKQQKNGNWELAGGPIPAKDAQSRQDPKGGQYTGRTAMAVLALLYSGESSQDPRIKEAVNFLLKTPTQGVYALGLRCQVWLALPETPEVKRAMIADAKVLLTSVRTAGNARGMYDYAPNPNGKAYSHSRSQYAVLGMWAAAQMGLEIPDAYWSLVEDGWRRNQDPDGGWTYMHPKESHHPTTPGMTTVGVATLYITQEYLRAGEGINCRGNVTNPSIEKGIAWLTKNIDSFPNKRMNDWKGRGWLYPTMYAYERVGAASGLRYFGKVDWYDVGADFLVKAQKPQGTWGGSNPTPHLEVTMDTCFAMLFLAKGRAPIVMSKLQFINADTKKEGKWNQRSRDVANVIRWTGRLLERELAFQIVNLDVGLEDIIESPVVYIAGSDALDLSPAHRDKLKAYIEAGGTVLANADCGSLAFTNSIKKLCKEMFPDYEFGDVKENDIVYTDYYPRGKWKHKFQVQSLHNGARHMVFLVPGADIGKAWQLQDSRSKVESFELAANIMLYAVDKQGLRYRGERYFLPDDPKLKPAQTITVARLKYPAIWNPEPGGWRQLNNVMLRRQATAVTTKPVELGKGELKDVKIAHLTGTVTVKFTDAQREEIKKFVEGGGTLIVDVAGGGTEFASAAEAELAAIFPDSKLELLPKEHALFSAGGGPADPDYAYRSFARRQIGRGVTGSRLQGIKVGDRYGVIYSREDLSEGLVGQQVDGIVGYTPESATDLMIRILNHAAGLKDVIKPPAAKPADKKAEPKKDGQKK